MATALSLLAAGYRHLTRGPLDGSAGLRTDGTGEPPIGPSTAHLAAFAGGAGRKIDHRFRLVNQR